MVGRAFLMNYDIIKLIYKYLVQYNQLDSFRKVHGDILGIIQDGTVTRHKVAAKTRTNRKKRKLNVPFPITNDQEVTVEEFELKVPKTLTKLLV